LSVFTKVSTILLLVFGAIGVGTLLMGIYMLSSSVLMGVMLVLVGLLILVFLTRLSNYLSTQLAIAQQSTAQSTAQQSNPTPQQMGHVVIIPNIGAGVQQCPKCGFSQSDSLAYCGKCGSRMVGGSASNRGTRVSNP